jgi:predicted 3-demethylubiquinone-9 3-methyltransferase (glyoxalase superfamily)
MSVRKFATHLWFDSQAQQAAELYTGLFDDSSIDAVILAPEGIPNAEPGSVLIVNLTIMGQRYIFLNGGPLFPFDSQVSLYVLCDDQDDVDHYWQALIADGGKPVQCGWLTDKFGLSWQVIPNRLEQLMDDDDPAVVNRVVAAMLGMVKLDIAELEAAARG